MFQIRTTGNPFQLLSDIRRGRWLLREYESLLPAVKVFLDGGRLDARLDAFAFSAVDAEFSETSDFSTASEPKKVAVIPVVGTITKYDTCYNYGAVTYAEAITEAADSEEICALVLDIDSGGGSVSAIAPVKEAIAYAKNLGKPVVAHVDMCASLAYWIASQCDAIFCDNSLSEVGGIGAYVHFVDDAAYMAKEGFTVVTAYADESPDKNLDYRQAVGGDTTLLRKDLSRIVSLFHADVKAGRPALKAEAAGVLTGAMFFPADAQRLGLADGVLTLSECVENAAIRSL